MGIITSWLGSRHGDSVGLGMALLGDSDCLGNHVMVGCRSVATNIDSHGLGDRYRAVVGNRDNGRSSRRRWHRGACGWCRARLSIAAIDSGGQGLCVVASCQPGGVNSALALCDCSGTRNPSVGCCRDCRGHVMRGRRLGWRWCRCGMRSLVVAAALARRDCNCARCGSGVCGAIAGGGYGANCRGGICGVDIS